LAIDEGLPLVLAAWSLATYVYDKFDAFPYLAITSPTKRCGKTRAAEVLDLFCANPLRTVGMTEAALFRSIARDKPTLFIDEAEGLRGADERQAALLGILNAGYRKGQTVRRCQGKNGSYDINEFEIYGPKVLILIGGLPDTLADRAIAIQMRRKHAGESVDRFISGRAKRETEHLKRACKKWADLNADVFTGLDEYISLPFLTDQEEELWLPLFAVITIAAPIGWTISKG